MERRRQVVSALGKENLELLLHEIEEGLIEDQQVKGIALAMENGVHGVYKQKKHVENQNLYVTMLHMLDRWWNKVLFDENVNGVQQLIQILQKNDLHRMKENSPQVDFFSKH